MILLPKINVVTLGCAKNLVDSERIMKQLSAAGYRVVHDSNDLSAKIVLINTCGFIGDAKEESVNTIMTFVAAKKQKHIRSIYVFGCLSQRYRDELQREIPEVDAFFGVDEAEKILAALHAEWLPDLKNERQLTTPPHYAYLKISEGCDRRCAYCAIPLIRGKHVSVPEAQLLDEARRLASQGVKELLVVAQDTTCYGLDLYGERRIAPLLNLLSDVNGIEWIRLHYAYPAQFPDDLIAVLRDNPKVCRYIDIPLQHISDAVLHHMRRGIDGAQTRALIERLRRDVPGIAIRTTFMVGHPGEDEQAFDELKAFVRDMQFERLGVFCYSEEESTYGAQHFKDEVSEAVKHARRDELMHIQAEIAEAQANEKIGETHTVIIDRTEDSYFVGRTEQDSPEADAEVYIKGSHLTVGKFYRVKITAADGYDLHAELGNE
ncbi:MAG: 30S ribosomal protein S12 methylthiotransferase RimO [Prevotellaceae bacterium]|jgi:ribosomal protein S12 methylthiotransferase|nr:30S ribosomal protein S12 methylthiotransferase RimO [Prevotellaceae bacterium]